ncbi:MAG: peptide chain release factor 1 [Pseudomonadota bacterium]|jgi:peptide chain release factor 1
MNELPEQKLEKVVERWASLQASLSAGGLDQQAFAKASKEFSEIDPVVATIRAYRQAMTELSDTEVLIDSGESDKEMLALAYEERDALRERVGELAHRIQLHLLPKDAADDKSAIVEIRAGTGGDEAALFAADLYRMYTRYAELHGWRTELVSASENDLGGYREVVVSISGHGAFARLKYEAGVHRVQRVPATEASGRIHTSAATVAVLPEAEEIDVQIRDEDIRIDTMRAAGAGGQHVNKTDSAVRITHLPTGIVVVSAEKSQHQNRRTAMQVLRSRLFEMERSRSADARASDRKSQVGSGDRSQRIRTYNFPQGRVTDHRINLTLHKLDAVLDGSGLDEIVDALITDHQATLLADMRAAG